MHSVTRSLEVRNTGFVPLRRQIALQLEGLIVEGRLEGGRRLPSVRALAAGLEVHRNTVAAAYRDLRQRGLVRAVVGSGAWVASERQLTTGTSPEAIALEQILTACRSRGACPRHSASRLARWLDALAAGRLAVRAPEGALGRAVCTELRARLPRVESRAVEACGESTRVLERWFPLGVTVPGAPPPADERDPAAFRLRLVIPGAVGRLARRLPLGSVVGLASSSDVVRRMVRQAVQIAAGDRVGVGSATPGAAEALRRLERIADVWWADATAIDRVPGGIRRRCRRLDLIATPSLRELERLLADAAADRERTLSPGVGEP